MPRGPLAPFYRFYLGRVLPLVGGLLSGDAAAYRYLPDTVLAWPSPADLEQEMRSVGLVDCGHALLSGGIACLSFGTVPPERDEAGGAVRE
jgi:demethylmenaquinone methyltransferase/2-methoxy-6-polyprenyl-1,4-benzoquinol methylase